ncbi:MAG: M1 family metallopeptidase [Bacteroidota bacterium]|nr:M1 family metallopeptidase [Bacteroidota bacterium]
MMTYLKISLVALVAFFVSCSTTKKLPDSGSDESTHVFLDSMEIIADDESGDATLPAYRPSRDRAWDLTHTALDLSFDWNKSTVIGTATLSLNPLFYPQTELKLDAVKFNIKKLMVNGVVAEYKYDSSTIVIPFTKPVTRRDRVTVVIDYTASPRPEITDSGAAITSDQGLFFIDPLDTTPDLPRQIWTQGETSSNRNWFPTLDQPNERGTQEIILTVADSFLTLSNGVLITSTKLANGMRRDHWKLELPHAPYLAMIAVGQWDKVSDTWRGRPVDYYVDPGYGPDARAIFAHTPEMIEFFSQKLGFDYVWPKYSQIIVKQFVSGAMENTTAVVFGDFIQFHEADVVESGVNDYIVSHELFHHWFGDLVTNESWSNLTLNEGFANYAEYLWAEFKYGREKADIGRISELSSYFDQATYDAHPLINYHYINEDAMFDAHSYNKGGLVLHMLRDLVGDEAFFASLRLYLQKHAYTAVEVHDLRQAFEETTGLDLNWFFNQWYLEKGHPVLVVNQSYDDVNKEVRVQFHQKQSEQGFKENFRLPIEISTIDASGKNDIHNLWLESVDTTYTLKVAQKPSAVVLDPRDILLAVVEQEIPASEYETRLLYTPSISHRLSAYRLMPSIPATALDKMMLDSSIIVRGLVISTLSDQKNAEKMYQLFQKEKDPDLQYFILQVLAPLDEMKAKLVAEKLLETTKKNPIIYDALMAISKIDLNAAILQTTRFQSNESPALYAIQAELYARKGSGVTLDYFKSEKAKSISIDYLEEYITSFALFLSKQPEAIQQQGLDLLKTDFYLQGPVPQYRRFYILTGLLEQYNKESNAAYKDKLRQTIKAIYANEPDDYLREILKEGFGNILD